MSADIRGWIATYEVTGAFDIFRCGAKDRSRHSQKPAGTGELQNCLILYQPGS
jgi:hypothetical protein